MTRLKTAFRNEKKTLAFSVPVFLFPWVTGVLLKVAITEVGALGTPSRTEEIRLLETLLTHRVTSRVAVWSLSTVKATGR